jgi:hypothetical protein
LRYFLISLTIVAISAAFFYTEEDWRGRRAWENCKRQLEAKGVRLDWTNYIPAPVLADENIFAVPAMQEWFVGRGETEFSKEISYPGYDRSNRTARLTIAELTIGLPGTIAPDQRDAVVLQWEDSQTKEKAGRLIKDALGPVVMAPAGFNFILRQPEEIRPAQIFLQCQTAPTEKELQQFLPKPIANTIFPDTEKIQIEPTGKDSYRVTMLAPDTVAEFLKWSGQLEPDLALIRKALKRPYGRMEGDYSTSFDMPIPNFVTIRILEQMLSAKSRCYMVLGQPGKALDELTLMHQLCRVLEARPTCQPMTLVAAMINVAVTGLCVDTIEEGIRLKVWQEPQLTALEEQLKEVNLHRFVANSIEFERQSICHMAEMASRDSLPTLFNLDWSKPQKFSPYDLAPRGWVYQNMVVCANLQQNLAESFASADQEMVPHKIEAAMQEVQSTIAHPYWSPFKLLAAIAIPNLEKAAQTLARSQTMANQAQIACALERYRLAHGEFPETLDALAPQFIETIPHDVIGGRPPHYRRNSDGTFLLYSIGWSQQDHGGHAGGQNDYSQTDSDFVWPEKWP